MTSEQQIRFQFLEEAEDYLNQIEAGLLGVSSEANLNKARLDSVMRAAHSIKGGAAMMGYQSLSEISHRLEDFFKIIRANRLTQIDSQTEQMFLVAVDKLRQCIGFYRQGDKSIEQSWLEETINPVLSSLDNIFGQLEEDDSLVSIDVENSSEDTAILIFQTEVDNMLAQLESQLAQEELEVDKLKEEFILTSQQFAGLGMILELEPLTELCSSISQYLEDAEGEQINWIASEAIKAWRQTQAMILVGETKFLPKTLNLNITIPEVVVERSRSQLETEFLELQSLISSAQESPEVVENTEQTIRVPLRQLEEVGNYLSEMIIERNGINLQLQGLQGLLKLLGERVKRLSRSNEELRTVYDVSNSPRVNNNGSNSIPLTTSTSSISSDFDSLEMDRYTALHPVLQELMEIIVQIQEVDVDLEYNVESTQRIARDLSRSSQMMQSKLTNLRMRPVSDLFGRLPRALRDLELRYNKQVNLNITGGNTLVDRPVLEALNEPLLHLLRNAFDHGIESAENRLEQNKSAKGTIAINASYRGNQTIIRISDDGNGINLARVRQKALDMGITEADIAKTSQTDLLQLIFLPGFSTAAKVTDLSGRGVGLDVVRNNLESIKGSIEVETQPGQGTAFTISVPLTLSIIRILLVETAGVLLAIPTNAVEEMILSSKMENFLESGQESIMWEGQPISLIRLNQWMYLPRLRYRPSSSNIPTVNEPISLIVSTGNRQVALQVDRFWGEQEVTIRKVEGPIQLPTGLIASTILNDGRVAPLVDTLELVRWIEKSQSDSTVVHTRLQRLSTYSLEDSDSSMIMVVDDSINVRRFLAITLEKAGYRVQQAKDGQEALERLKDKLPIQAVVCDIEMPRLDGYGFLTQVRAQSQYNSLPIIMLTSRSGEKHRQIAMNLGATDYFSKPFLEQDLVRALRSVIKTN